MADATTILNINWGDGIAPAGGGRPELPFGAFRARLTKPPVVRQSQVKNSKTVVLAVEMLCLAAGKGYDQSAVGLVVADTMTLPEGNDYSEDTNQGKGNRARVSELKAFLLAFGMAEEVVRKSLNGAPGALDLTPLAGKEAVVFNEPSIPGEKNSFPEVQYVSPERAGSAMEGAYKPKLKQKGSSAAKDPMAAGPQVGNAANTAPVVNFAGGGFGSPDFTQIAAPGPGPTIALGDNGAGGNAASGVSPTLAAAFNSFTR